MDPQPRPEPLPGYPDTSIESTTVEGDVNIDADVDIEASDEASVGEGEESDPENGQP